MSESLYLKRFRAKKASPLGYVIRYLKTSSHDIEAEVEKYLVARFLVPALRQFKPDQDVEWHARESIAQIESWANVFRECYGLSGFTKPDPLRDQNGAIVSPSFNDLNGNDAQADANDQEAKQLDEQMTLARSFLEI